VSLETAGQWGIVLSPLVATTVFVFTVWFDRRRRQRERFTAALDLARAEVIRAANWAGLPGTSHVLGGGLARSFHAVSSFALCVPRRYGSIALWLMQGATTMTTASHSRDRTDAQNQMLKLLVVLTPGNRRAFRAAAEHVERNPWSAVETGTPVWLRRAIGPMYWLLRLISGDSTYGTASEPIAEGAKAGAEPNADREASSR